MASTYDNTGDWHAVFGVPSISSNTQIILALTTIKQLLPSHSTSGALTDKMPSRPPTRLSTKQADVWFCEKKFYSVQANMGQSPGHPTVPGPIKAR